MNLFPAMMMAAARKRAAVLLETTITGLRISAVDGTAFIDNAAALTPYADGAKYIEIIDSAGAKLTGWLEAVGTGETLGAELIASWDNDATSPFTTFSTAGTDIMSAISASLARCSAGVVVDAYKLYLYEGVFTKNSGTFSYLVLASSASGSLPGVFILGSNPASGAKTVYLTSIDDRQDFLAIFTSVGVDFSLTSNTFKQVTAPSTSGATIVSAKNGSTNNFASVEAGFIFNEASYDVVVRR